jgi:hypothetical protein
VKCEEIFNLNKDSSVTSCSTCRKILEILKENKQLSEDEIFERMPKNRSSENETQNTVVNAERLNFDVHLAKHIKIIEDFSYVKEKGFLKKKFYFSLSPKGQQLISNNFNDQSSENMRFAQDEQATISNTIDTQFIKLASVQINKSIDAVWKFFVDSSNWVKWHGGALLEVKPDWSKGGELIWKLGYPSRIKEIIPLKVVETVSSPSQNIVRWTFAQYNGSVLFELEQKYIGTRIADMEKVLQNNQSKLDNFKKLVESETTKNETAISNGTLEAKNTHEKASHLQMDNIGITCPLCKGKLNENSGSPISPYLNLYTCSKCSWRGLKCGRRGCIGTLKEEKMSNSSTVRYECTQCGWSCTGPKLV